MTNSQCRPKTERRRPAPTWVPKVSSGAADQGRRIVSCCSNNMGYPEQQRGNGSGSMHNGPTRWGSVGSPLRVLIKLAGSRRHNSARQHGHGRKQGESALEPPFHGVTEPPMDDRQPRRSPCGGNRARSISAGHPNRGRSAQAVRGGSGTSVASPVATMTGFFRVQVASDGVRRRDGELADGLQPRGRPGHELIDLPDLGRKEEEGHEDALGGHTPDPASFGVIQGFFVPVLDLSVHPLHRVAERGVHAMNLKISSAWRRLLSGSASGNRNSS